MKKILAITLLFSLIGCSKIDSEKTVKVVAEEPSKVEEKDETRPVEKEPDGVELSNDVELKFRYFDRVQ
ncbi:hypothetical protein [Bacillus sp. EB01]|uniref:hypothetical protein n=1 Tax=Bacillus sp. EB01 TaxID=1347086 RepID=UPI0005C6493D|nr:hypothetical protein [Bacillus sp. EB01]